MVDEKTMTARYEIAGRRLLQRELTCGQLQKLSALKDAQAIAGKDEFEFTLFMPPRVAVQFLSAVLTEEDGSAVEITAEPGQGAEAGQGAKAPLPYGKIPVRVFMEVLGDFFLLNPALGEFLSTWLRVILNSGSREKSDGNGKDPNSGSTLPPPPAEETSVDVAR